MKCASKEVHMRILYHHSVDCQQQSALLFSAARPHSSGVCSELGEAFFGVLLGFGVGIPLLLAIDDHIHGANLGIEVNSARPFDDLDVFLFPHREERLLDAIDDGEMIAHGHPSAVLIEIDGAILFHFQTNVGHRLVEFDSHMERGHRLIAFRRTLT